MLMTETLSNNLQCAMLDLQRCGYSRINCVVENNAENGVRLKMKRLVVMLKEYIKLRIQTVKRV